MTPARAALAGLALFGSLLVLPLRAGFVGTEYFRYARMEDYENASFRELILADDGSWRLGPRWEDLFGAEIDFFSELAAAGDQFLIAGGGNPGTLILFDRRTERGREIHSAPELLFSCVEALADGGWAVGSGPGGVVYRVSPRGEVSELLRTEQEFVWDLLREGKQLYIATGSQGLILRHDLARGETARFASLPDRSAFCLTRDGEGRLLAGSSGAGLLYRFRPDGTGEQLADFDAEDVQALVAGADGTITVAVAQAEEDCKENCAAVYALAPDGRLEKMLGADSAFIGDLLPAAGGGIWVAAGDPGELDRLVAPYHGEVLAVEPERYYSDLALDADGETLWLLQSKPARLTRIGGRAEQGTLTSEILDLNNRSLAGALRLEAELPRGCGLAVEGRAGHGSEPGEGWTDWTPARPDTEAPGESVGVSHRLALPAARYFQWRVHFTGADGRSPRLYRVTASFLPLNRSPLIGNLALLRPEAGPFEDAIDLGGRPVTQVLERGVRVQYQQKGEPEPSADPDFAGLRGLRELHWDWLDPDADRLRARIELQREGEPAWQTLVEDWTSNTWTWDTRGFADGQYRLRLTVDDGLDNAAGFARASEALSERVLLDSAPPTCALRLERQGGRLRLAGRVEDATSLLTRVELRLGEEPWRSLAPADGLMDRQALALDLDLGPAGAATRLELRASDEYGNWGYYRRGLREDGQAPPGPRRRGS